MFGLFNSGEKHVIDGRTVYITGLRKLERAAASETRTIILEFCTHRPIARRFPALTFEITEYAATGTHDARADLWSAPYGKKTSTTIYISTRTSTKNLPELLEHEAVHLWQATEEADQRMLEKQLHFQDRRDLVREGSLDTIEGRSAYAVAGARHMLVELFKNLINEGLATYAEKQRKGETVFSINDLERVHENAAQEAQTFFERRWSPFITSGLPTLIVKSQKHELKDALSALRADCNRIAYDIGYAMTYAILMEGEASFEDIISWSDHKFVKRYEQACHTLGLRPIVTLTAAAPFCYNTMIRQCIDIPRQVEIAKKRLQP